jgi:excisionase family DNA binding protein
MLAPERNKTEYEYITVREFADYVRVDPQTVYRWIREGRIKAVTFGSRMRRIHIDELHRFVGEDSSGNS